MRRKGSLGLVRVIGRSVGESTSTAASGARALGNCTGGAAVVVVELIICRARRCTAITAKRCVGNIGDSGRQALALVVIRVVGHA